MGGGGVASMAKTTNAPRILVGKTEGKRRIMNFWTPLMARISVYLNKNSISHTENLLLLLVSNSPQTAGSVL